MWILWMGLLVQTTLLGLLLERAPVSEFPGCVITPPPARRAVFVHVEGLEAWPPLVGALASATCVRTDIQGPLAPLSGLTDDHMPQSFNSFFGIKKEVSSLFDGASLSIYSGPLSVAELFGKKDGSMPFKKKFAPAAPSIWQVCSQLPKLIGPDDALKQQVLIYAHVPVGNYQAYSVMRIIETMVAEVEKKFYNDGQTAWVITTDGKLALIWGPGIKSRGQQAQTTDKFVISDLWNETDISNSSEEMDKNWVEFTFINKGDDYLSNSTDNLSRDPLGNINDSDILDWAKYGNGLRDKPEEPELTSYPKGVLEILRNIDDAIIQREITSVTKEMDAKNFMDSTSHHNLTTKTISNSSEDLSQENLESIFGDEEDLLWDPPLLINRTDLAALIGAVTGIPPAKSSMGFLPNSLLTLSPTQMAQAAGCNALQLAFKAQQAMMLVPGTWLGDCVDEIEPTRTNISLEYDTCEEAENALKTASKLGNAALVALERSEQFFCLLDIFFYGVTAMAWICILVSELMPTRPTPPPFLWNQLSSHPKVQSMMESVRRMTLQRMKKSPVRMEERTEEQGDGMTEVPLNFVEPSPVIADPKWRKIFSVFADAIAIFGLVLAISVVVSYGWPIQYLYYTSTTVIAIWTALRGIITSRVLGEIKGIALVAAVAVALAATFDGTPGMAFDGGTMSLQIGAPGASALAFFALLTYGSQNNLDYRLGAFTAAIILIITVPWPAPSNENPWFLYPAAIAIMALTLTSVWLGGSYRTIDLGVVIGIAAIQGTAFILTAISDAVGGMGPFGAFLVGIACMFPVVEAIMVRNLAGRDKHVASVLAIPVLLLSSWTEPLILAAAAVGTIFWVLAEKKSQTPDHFLRGLIVVLIAGTTYTSLGGLAVVYRVAASPTLAPALSLFRQFCSVVVIASATLSLPQHFIPTVFLAPAIIASFLPLPVPPFLLSSYTRIAVAIFQIILLSAFIVAKYLYRMGPGNQ